MRNVYVSEKVRGKIIDLRRYLVVELQLSEEAANRRIDRMRRFIVSFGNPVAYPLCRFKRWHELGYRCAVFEKAWVFAYEEYFDGIMLQDLSHTALLTE